MAETTGTTDEESAQDSAPPDQNFETLFSEEQPQTQTLFNLLYPSGFESVALFNREVPHARACAEKLAKEKVSVRELLKYNRTHKSAGLVFRSCAQLLKALSTDEQRVLQDFVGHDASSCRTCAPGQASRPRDGCLYVPTMRAAR